MENVVMKLDKALQNIAKDSERLHWILTGSEGFDECNFDGFSENLLLDFTTWQEIVKEFYHKLHVEKQKIVKASVTSPGVVKMIVDIPDRNVNQSFVTELIAILEDELSFLQAMVQSGNAARGVVTLDECVGVLHALIQNAIQTGNLGKHD